MNCKEENQGDGKGSVEDQNDRNMIQDQKGKCGQHGDHGADGTDTQTNAAEDNIQDFFHF